MTLTQEYYLGSPNVITGPFKMEGGGRGVREDVTIEEGQGDMI